MQSNSLEQLRSFAIFILVGFLIGLLLDSFRILRKTFKTSDFVTAIEDVLFWILTGLLVLFSIFKFNNGSIRVYIILGIFIGTTIYMLIFSKIVVGTLVKIINFIKKIILYIVKFILYPINIIKKFILNIIIKPIFNTIRKVGSSNVLSFMSKLCNKKDNKLKNTQKEKKRQNKSNFKKDFA